MMWRARDPAASRLRRGDRRAVSRTSSRISTSGSTRSSARRSTRLGPTTCSSSCRTTVHVVAARVSPEQLAARQRLSRRARSATPTRTPGSSATWTGRRRAPTALGLNGLYINLKGREKHGIVEPGDRDGAGRRDRGEAARDDRSRRPARRRSRRCTGAKRSTRWPGIEDIAPDLIVGYAKGTRGSDESALGGLPREVIVDNTDAWSGDHCMDPDAVPGILLTSRPLEEAGAVAPDARRGDLAEFGVDRVSARSRSRTMTCSDRASSSTRRCSPR